METGGISGGDGGSSEGEKKKPQEGEAKVKRKMKTASQLEVLEKTYATEMYPSEATRAELSVQLGLSDRQLQMWFCHRRLKDRKAAPLKRQRKDSTSSAHLVGVAGEEMGGSEAGNEHGLGGSSLLGHGLDLKRVVPRAGMTIPRYYEMPHSMAELELRAIKFAELQLGEPIRDDGPMFGMEFDPLPPGAFGAPIAVQQKQPGGPFETKIYDRRDTKTVKGSVRAVCEYQFLLEQPTVRTETYGRFPLSVNYGLPTDGPNARALSLAAGSSSLLGNEQEQPGYGFPGQIPNLNLLPQQSRPGHLLPTASGEYDYVSRTNTSTNTALDANIGSHPISALGSPFVSSDRRVCLDDDVLRKERKRKGEEDRIAREIEAHEKRIRRELEKQDMLKRKREEQIRKEMRRHEHEKRKEEERLLREKHREEERYQREQRRELERREKFLMKESIRAERLRQKEELRKEKEAARLRAANERAIARKLAKESMEPVEDEYLELMEIATSSQGLSLTLPLGFEALQNLDIFRDKLCEFPPKTVQLKRPFSIQPWNGSEENVGNLLMVWRFLITFADVLGLWPFTLDELVQAFHDYDPRLLGEIHVALLRSIIKDIEDVARTPSTGAGASQNSAANPGGGHPQIVEGAYAWGFDIRSWQRHLNVLTWPEILRQFALSAGFGPQLKKRNIEQAYLCDGNEVSIPFEALQSTWTDDYRNSWGMKLDSSTTAEELLQILTLLESSIRRDYLSSKFETTSEVLSPSNLSGHHVDYSFNLEAVPVLPWIPKTTAAVALRLMEFNAAISYTLTQGAETKRDRGAEEFMELPPSKYAFVKNHQDDETMQTPNQVKYLQKASWDDVGIGFSGSGRGEVRRRGLGVICGGRYQRRPANSRSGSRKRIATAKSGRLRPVVEWKSRSQRQGGRNHGRRSSRRPKVANRMVESAGEGESRKEIMGKSSRSCGMNAWNGDEVALLETGTADNGRSSESSGYKDEIRDECDYEAVDEYGGGFNGKDDDGEGSDYDIDDGEEAEIEERNLNGGYIKENSVEGVRDAADDLPYGYSTEGCSGFSE
ncbi:hypothetical protein ERO13_D12G143800v2 [Gossypium hirsutum]|uniref:Homeobox-DDT domain protein RLT2 isoform X2 n=1 Tax=Gossypium hirsutum TaxID=3635 RepID=A0A1U8N9X4_GOSHI|nr:homeobox-DDT domain protein RLT2 isoform X2 [Gossypium hirsutum]KAG4116015.1 hypothetical protein ERO13_D12G143800v2 [Gossypium hirsutum]